MEWVVVAFCAGLALGRWLEHRVWLKAHREAEKEFDAFVEKAIAEIDALARAVQSEELDEKNGSLH